MDKTLLIWQTDSGVRLYLLPESLARGYEQCDGAVLNGEDDDDIELPVSERIQHLAAMIGCELYYGESAVPDFETFRKTIGYDEPTNTTAALAPWKALEVSTTGVSIDKPFGAVMKVIRTGWMF